MSISLNSTSKWKARNMPSFLAYIEEQDVYKRQVLR